MTGRRLAVTAAGTVLLLAFWFGRLSVPPAAVELRPSPTPGCVEVWRDGELAAEWEMEDGDVYEILRQVLVDDPKLYLPTEPGGRGRGRGPALREARAEGGRSNYLWSSQKNAENHPS